MGCERHRELRRRRRRKLKLRKLRARLAASTDRGERQRLIDKIHKISPTAPVPEP